RLRDARICAVRLRDLPLARQRLARALGGRSEGANRDQGNLMAFAEYFGKNLQAASFLLQGIDPDAFKHVLASDSVGIAFDENAASTAEGQATLDLTTRLLARLVPALTYFPMDTAAKRAAKNLEAVAKTINPNIDLGTCSLDSISRVLIVGMTSPQAAAAKQLVFVGSDNWLARVSASQPVGSKDSGNPFGAGAAACIGVANIFRQLFASHLPNPKVDEGVTFSTLDMAVSQEPVRNPAWKDMDLGELFLVGNGAIGSGFLWCLRHTSATGTLHVIDGETVELTNLQRYAMTTSGDEDMPKSELAKKWLAHSKITVEPHAKHWREY